jgi:hypothetical protein
MKKIFALVVVLVAVALSSTNTFAQKGFEGVITYKISVKGEGADQMKAFMPTKMEVYAKSDGNSRVKMDGMMPQDLLTLKNVSYMMKATEKVAYKMPDKSKLGEKGEEPKVTVTNTGEKLTIAGYECIRYVLDVEVKGQDGGTQSISMSVWATDKIKVSDDAKSSMLQGVNAKVPGMLLKMKIVTGPVEMEFVATEVKTAKLNSADFAIPAGYSIKDYDPSAMGGMGF